MLGKYIILPTGAKMPAVGLGTWQADDPKQLEDAMNAAFQNGYRHFDTAYLYGNESILGEVIEKWISKGVTKREELFIVTKLPMSGNHPDRVEMFLDKSLKSLRLDYVDLYLIHFPVCVKYDENVLFPVDENGVIQTEPTDIIALWKKMEELVHSGKVKSIGLSNFNQNQITRIMEHAVIKPANLQIEIHLYHQNKDLVKFCKDKGITIVAYSPLGSPGYNTYSEKKGRPLKNLPALLSNEVVLSIAKKHTKTPAQVMLRFLVQSGLAVIPKTTNIGRMKENISIFDFELDDGDMKVLESLDQGKDAKIFDINTGFEGFSKHPEYPFN